MMIILMKNTIEYYLQIKGDILMNETLTMTDFSSRSFQYIMMSIFIGDFSCIYLYLAVF